MRKRAPWIAWCSFSRSIRSARRPASQADPSNRGPSRTPTVGFSLNLCCSVSLRLDRYLRKLRSASACYRDSPMAVMPAVHSTRSHLVTPAIPTCSRLRNRSASDVRRRISAPRRSRHGPRRLHRRIGRVDRHDHAWRAGRLRRAVDHPRQLRDQAGRSGGVGPLHHRHGTHRPRGVRPRAWAAPRRQLAGVGLGHHGRADAAAGRRHVRRRGAGPAPAGAGDPGERLGGDLPRCITIGGSARRRLRAHREAGHGEGGLLHDADGLRRCRAAAVVRRDDGQRSRRRAEPARCRPRASPRRLPCSGSPASARPSWCSTRTGASRKATRGSSGRGTDRGVDRAGARLDPRHAPRHRCARS